MACPPSPTGTYCVRAWAESPIQRPSTCEVVPNIDIRWCGLLEPTPFLPSSLDKPSQHRTGSVTPTAPLATASFLNALREGVESFLQIRCPCFHESPPLRK